MVANVNFPLFEALLKAFKYKDVACVDMLRNGMSYLKSQVWLLHICVPVQGQECLGL